MSAGAPIWIAMAAASNAAASLFLKYAAIADGVSHGLGRVSARSYLAAIIAYVLAFGAYRLALASLPVNVTYAAISGATVVFLGALGPLFLGEPIRTAQILGLVLIVIGISLALSYGGGVK
jgi:multidrug transporter EmrE-like cation transporter